MNSPARTRALLPDTPSVFQERPPAAAREARDAQLAAWLAASALGDTRAFESFYEGTFAFARTVARRLLRQASEVEDLLADCYFEAWRSASRFDPTRGSPVTWLLTLVRSRALDTLRTLRSERTLHVGGPAGSTPPAPDGTAEPSIPEVPAPDADPAEQLWQRQSGAELHAALATLSAPERWVLGLAYLRELSHTEIAQCTGMPLGTVKSHAQRAQNKLRDRLGPSLHGHQGAAGAQRAAP